MEGEKVDRDGRLNLFVHLIPSHKMTSSHINPAKAGGI